MNKRQQLTFSYLAGYQLQQKKPKEKNIIMKIGALTARGMIERDKEKMLLLKESYERFQKYQMDVDDYPPSDHCRFMEKLASMIQDEA